MTGKDYIHLATRTEAQPTDFLKERLLSNKMIRLLHSGMGLNTEAGEFLDAIKKCVFYGARLDEVNLKEELGDLLWYIAIACDVLETTPEELMETNIKKLTKRFPRAFEKDQALIRDLVAERKILEE